jgi:hypothetical protein
MPDMTVREALEILQDQDPDAKLRIMSQARHPIEYGVEIIAPCTDLDEHFKPSGTNATRENVVYLAEGTEHGYGTRSIWDLGC